ncbi:MAG: arabinogalactan endo-beta-1,4-galactanase [Lentimicrobium sp.]
MLQIILNISSGKLLPVIPQSFIRKIIFFSGPALLLLIASCGNHTEDPVPVQEKLIIKAADLSFLPEIEDAGFVFYNRAGEAEEMLTTLKKAGMNTVRIRLWKDPANGRSGFTEVKAFAEKIRAMGMKVYLTVHYSGTWADPGSQIVPEAWRTLGYHVLKDSLYNYTEKIIKGIKPDYIQIGNEINNGMLWPQGKNIYLSNFLALLNAGSKAVRENDPDCKIMIHYAGIDKADEFFTSLDTLDYDIIGLSYYPVWHGKSLGLLETTLDSLGKKFDKQVFVAETSYPFSFGWNDWTTNVIGDESQILDAYPATPEGQKAFAKEIKRISTATEKSIGFAYWGGEWVAFKGPESANGSPWENMAFYDFENKALPVIEVFGEY